MKNVDRQSICGLRFRRLRRLALRPQRSAGRAASEAKLRDLFEVARFTERPVAVASAAGGVDRWIAAFKHKREEIASVTCPS